MFYFHVNCHYSFLCVLLLSMQNVGEKVNKETKIDIKSPKKMNVRSSFFFVVFGFVVAFNQLTLNISSLFVVVGGFLLLSLNAIL